MENKDEKLWAIAQKRANFKKELYTYIVVTLFLWAIWLVTNNDKAIYYKHQYTHTMASVGNFRLGFCNSTQVF